MGDFVYDIINLMKTTIRNPLLKYENKWVALSKGKKVVAYANSIKELDRKLRKTRSGDFIVTKVLPFNIAYSP